MELIREGPSLGRLLTRRTMPTSGGGGFWRPWRWSLISPLYPCSALVALMETWGVWPPKLWRWLMKLLLPVPWTSWGAPLDEEASHGWWGSVVEREWAEALNPSSNFSDNLEAPKAECPGNLFSLLMEIIWEKHFQLSVLMAPSALHCLHPINSSFL